MNKDVLKIVRKLEELVKDAEDHYRANKTALNHERLIALWSARDIAKDVFFDSMKPERLPQMPRIRLDDLPEPGDPIETEREFHERMVEKYGNTWRLEFHDEAGLHWNLNDEVPANTFGFRTVLTCKDDDVEDIDEKATAVWWRLVDAHGRVDYVEFYKAMNA